MVFPWAFHIFWDTADVARDARNFAFRTTTEDSAKFPADTFSLTHSPPPPAPPINPHFSHIPKALLFAFGWVNA